MLSGHNGEQNQPTSTPASLCDVRLTEAGPYTLGRQGRQLFFLIPGKGRVINTGCVRIEQKQA